MKNRSLYQPINTLALSRKRMAFVSGPRQVGKTTLARMFLKKQEGRYYNWDDLDFRKIWTRSPRMTTSQLENQSILILDEIHKAAKWKQNLKGLYDTLEKEIKIIVTGSARLDLYRKGSDSLMGRYVGFRLHPFSIGEILTKTSSPPGSLEEIFSGELSVSSSKRLWDLWEDLTVYGGFPEPLLSSSEKILNIWQKGRIDKIVREDMRDLSRIPELSKIEMLISLLPERVSNPIGLNSLRENLEVSYDTVKRWMNYLKDLYYHFEIQPWSTNIARSLKKEKKIYLWDWSEIKDPGARFENMVASHLLKACHYWTDSGEGKFDLYYLKTKDKKEIDFLMTKNGKPWIPVECKLKKTNISPNLSVFAGKLKTPVFFQLVNEKKILKKQQWEGTGVYVCSAPDFLRHLP